MSLKLSLKVGQQAVGRRPQPFMGQQRAPAILPHPQRTPAPPRGSAQRPEISEVLFLTTQPLPSPHGTPTE